MLWLFMREGRVSTQISRFGKLMETLIDTYIIWKIIGLMLLMTLK